MDTSEQWRGQLCIQACYQVDDGKSGLYPENQQVNHSYLGNHTVQHVLGRQV